MGSIFFSSNSIHIFSPCVTKREYLETFRQILTACTDIIKTGEALNWFFSCLFGMMKGDANLFVLSGAIKHIKFQYEMVNYYLQKAGELLPECCSCEFHECLECVFVEES